MLLVALLENHMLSRMEQLQSEYRRDVEELRASAKGLQHQVLDHMAVQEASPDKVAAMRSAAEDAESQRRVLTEASNLTASGAVPAMGAEQAEDSDGQATRLRLRSSSTRSRKLAGYYAVGTSGSGVACASFTGAATEADLSTSSCLGASTACSGCFIALDDGNDKVLEIIKCAQFKAGRGSPDTSHMVEIMVMNSDPDHTLTVKGCADSYCALPASTYQLSGGDTVVGFCYAGGSNKIYFPTRVFQTTSTYNFAGKTIADLGSVTTADLNGGTIDNMDITVGAAKTLNVSGGTIILADGQIAATKVTGGLFTSNQVYNFASSTITDLGQVNDVDLIGGSISGVSITVGATKSLDVSAGALTLASGQVDLSKIAPGVFEVGSYSFAGSTVANLGQVSTVDLRGGQVSGVTLEDSDYHLGSGHTLNASAGTLTLGAGQVSADAVGGGTFNAGTFSFAGSTVTDLGQVNTADINGGTLDGVAVGQQTASVGSFTTLKASSHFQVSQELRSQYSGDIPTQSGVVFSSEPSLPANSYDSISMTCPFVTSYNVVVGAVAPVSNCELHFANILPQNGGFTTRVYNQAATACAGPYYIMFFSLQAR